MSEDIRAYKEHQKYEENITYIPKIISPSLFNAKENRYFNDKERFSYYIGAMWLDQVTEEKESLNNTTTTKSTTEKTAVIVKTKIQNIDFMKMFISCLANEKSAKDFDSIYHIYFNEDYIEYKDRSSLPEIEPLTIAHFIYSLEAIIKKGLKHNFIYREENLSKIKGKLILKQHIKENIMKAREYKAFCRFSEYDRDCVENRILKKALLICQKKLSNNYTEINTKLSHCLSVFQGVNEQVTNWELSHTKLNPIYREYKSSIEVAKRIIKLQRQKEGKEKASPPFWIDMPLLFERYVYSLMLKNKDQWNNVLYQKRTQRGIPDFLLTEDNIIADTKYRMYEDKIILEHARQLSAYARTVSIRKEFGYNNCDTTMIDCLIIYPNLLGSDDLILDNIADDKGYTKFYKLGIKLPVTN